MTIWRQLWKAFLDICLAYLIVVSAAYAALLLTGTLDRFQN